MRVHSGVARLFLSCLFAGVALITATAGVASAATEPSRDLDKYVLFADQSINFKGGANSSISGGHVGVNRDNPDPNATELIFGGDGTTISPDSAQVVAQKVGATSNTSLCEVFANETTVGYNPVVRPGCSALQSWAPVPIIDTLPALPSFSPGSGTTTIAAGAPVSLPPDSYGTVEVKDNATLVLEGGTYNLRDLLLGKKTTVVTEPDTVVKITGQLKINNGDDAVDADSSIGSDLTRWYFNSVDVPGGAHTVSFGRHITFRGTVYAPNGSMALGHDNDLYGRFWGKSVVTDSNDRLVYKAPDSVSGKKFLDSNGNGQQDAGENGLAGFTFYVDVNDNGQLDPTEPSAVSASDGTWSIGPLYLPQKSYTVREVQQTGYTCTFPGTCTYSVNLQGTGTNYGGNDFGNKPETKCVPQPGQDANCQPIVKCVPQPGQDANCQPIKPVGPSVTNSARLRGPSGCVTSSSVRVSGSNIKKVTFSYNGKKRVVKKSPFKIKIKKKQLKPGGNRITAKIQFKDGKTETQRLTVQRCGATAVSPDFTG